MDRTLVTAIVGAGVGAAVAALVTFGLAARAQPKAEAPAFALNSESLDNRIRNAVLSQASALREAVPGPKVYPPVATPAVQVRSRVRAARVLDGPGPDHDPPRLPRRSASLSLVALASWAATLSTCS